MQTKDHKYRNESLRMEMPIIHHLASERLNRPSGTWRILGDHGFITCCYGNSVALSMQVTSTIRTTLEVCARNVMARAVYI
jgi:hypothetical protein